MSRKTLCKLIPMAALLCLSAAAQAGTVTNTDDSGPGSLRQVILEAADGDTIYFDLSPPATITLTSGPLAITKTLTIAGPGAANLAVTTNGASGVIAVASGKTVTVSGLTLRDGKAEYGGGIHSSGNLTVADCTFAGNIAEPVNPDNTVSLAVRATDFYGASDTETVTVSVSALALSGVTLTRNSDGTLTCKFQINNATTQTVNTVTVTVGRLGGVNTNMPLPLYYFTIKAGASKQGTLQFKGVPSGQALLLIEGSSSLGGFFLTQTVNVP